MLVQKLLDTVIYWVFDATKTEKTWLMVKLFCVGMLIVAKLDYWLFQKILQRNDRGIVAILSWWLLIWYMDEIVRYLYDRVRSFDQKTEPKHMIDKIDVDDLVAFMFEYNWLPVEDMKRYFDVSNEDIKKLGDNLERVGLLWRGKDNRRVLMSQDPEYVTRLLLSHPDSNKIWWYSTTGVSYKPLPIED